MGNDSSNWIMAKHFDLEVMTTLITAVLENATSNEIENGRNWYPIARQFCLDLAKKYHVKLEVVTAVTSALSPGNNWDKNQADVKALFKRPLDFTTSTYKKNKIKALKFYHGRLIPSVAYGQNNWSKTACFFDNISNPTSSKLVTLDRHASRVCHGYNLTPNEAILYVNTKPKYSLTSQAFRIVASQAKLRPLECQAITWLVYKRLFADVRKKTRETAVPIPFHSSLSGVK
jgi:hypothetical protein